MAKEPIVFLHIPKTGGRWLKKHLLGIQATRGTHNIPDTGPYWCVMRDPEIWIQSYWGFWKFERNHPQVQGIETLNEWLKSDRLPQAQAHWAGLCNVEHRALLEIPQSIERLSSKPARGYKTFEYDYEFDRTLLRKKFKQDYELYTESLEYWKEWLSRSIRQ